MKKNIIVGAGFSAFIAKILSKKDIKILGSINHDPIKDGNLFRRKSLETNKLMSKKSLSYGSLQFNLKSGKLHDRLILGGNSNIWGGKINTKKISKNIKNLFIKYKVFLKNLSFKTTGTISNNEHIMQMQTIGGKIFESKHLPLKIKNAYLVNFYTEKKSLDLIPGEVHNVKFFIENRGNSQSSGLASLDIQPVPFKSYISKIGCFCYEKQSLKPKEKKEFLLTFFLDPKIKKNNKIKDISDIKLSFTFSKTN